MIIDGVVFGTLGFLLGWLIKKYLLASRGGLSTGGTIGLCAVVWIVTVLVIGTWLQGQRNYLMENLLDKAIQKQHERDPSWLIPERQPITHGTSSPIAGNAATSLAFGLFWGIRRRAAVSSKPARMDSLGSDDSTNSPTSPDEEAAYEAAAKEFKGDSLNQGLYEKALTLVNGSVSKVRSKYIALRVAQLMSEKQQLDAVAARRRTIKWGSVTLGVIAYGVWIYYAYVVRNWSVFDTWWTVAITFSPVYLLQAFNGDTGKPTLASNSNDARPTANEHNSHKQKVGFATLSENTIVGIFLLIVGVGFLYGLFLITSMNWMMSASGLKICGTALLIGLGCGAIFLLGRWLYNQFKRKMTQPSVEKRFAAASAALVSPNKKISLAVGAAVFSGSVSLLLSVLVIMDVPIRGFSAWNLSDAALAFGLGYGIYRKSRVCSVLMLLTFIGGQAFLIQGGSHPGGLSILVGVLFFIIYVRGVIGTVTFHRIERQTKRHIVDTPLTNYAGADNIE